VFVPSLTFSFSVWFMNQREAELLYVMVWSESLGYFTVLFELRCLRCKRMTMNVGMGLVLILDGATHDQRKWRKVSVMPVIRQRLQLCTSQKLVWSFTTLHPIRYLTIWNETYIRRL
jgi:hypothetical protein